MPANADSLWRWHRHRPDMPSGPTFLFRAGLIFVCKPTGQTAANLLTRDEARRYRRLVA